MSAGAPDDVERIGRFEWERAVLRLAMPTTTKLVALTLAIYGNRDGSGIHPGEARLARELGLSQRSVRGHLWTLRERLRLIVRESHGGSRSGLADTYRLGLPNDLDPALVIADPALHRKPTAGVSEEPRNVASGDPWANDTELRQSSAEPRKVGAGTPEAQDPITGTVLPPTKASTKLDTTPETSSGVSDAARCDNGVPIAADGFCCPRHALPFSGVA